MITGLLGAAIVFFTVFAVVERNGDFAVLALLIVPLFLLGVIPLYYSTNQRPEEQPQLAWPRYSGTAVVVFCFAVAGVLVNVLASLVAPTWEGWLWLRVLAGVAFSIAVVVWVLSRILRWLRRRKSESELSR